MQQREQGFQYAKKSLPDGWKVLDQYGTSTYLEAVYGEGENAPTLSVSVLQYDDSHGYGKAQALAEAKKTAQALSAERKAAAARLEKQAHMPLWRLASKP